LAKRILRIINRLNLGGPTYNVAFLSKFLAPEFETMLLAGIKLDEEESSEFIVRDMGLQPSYVTAMHRNINPLEDFAAYREIKKKIKEFRPDIVHTHAAKAGTLGRLAAIHCKVPVILHTFHGHVFHSYFGKTKTRVFLEIERYLAARTSGIIAISEIQKNELCNDFKVCPAEKAFVVPLGFDLSRFQTDMDRKRNLFRKKYLLQDDEIAIGIIGRLTAIKNHTLFLNALALLKKSSGNKIKAFIIGDGEDRSMLLELCVSLNLKVSEEPDAAADVMFTSWIKDIDIAIAGLDLVALTSLNEGTPVSLIEAQAGNKAVISTRVGGIENVVAENRTALLSDSGNAESLSANMKRLVEDDSLRNSFAEAGWDQVKDKFHYTGLVGNMRRLYHELLRS